MKVRRKSDPSGAVLDLPTNEVAAGVLRGEFLVESGAQLPVRNKAGVVGHVPVEKYLEAVRSNEYTPLTTEELEASRQKKRDEAEYGGVAGKATAAVTSALSGVTVGGTDVAIGDYAPDPVREYVRGARRTNPLTSAAANVAGTVGALVAARGKGGAKPTGALGRFMSNTPAGLTARGGAAIEQYVARGLASPPGATAGAARRVAQYMLPKVAAGAAEGAVMGVGQGYGEDSLDNIDASTDRLVAHGARGAIFGGAATAALSGTVGLAGAAVRRVRSDGGLLGRSGSRLEAAAAEESKPAMQRFGEWLERTGGAQRVQGAGGTPARLREYAELRTRAPEAAGQVDEILRGSGSIDDATARASEVRTRAELALDDIEMKGEAAEAWEYAPRFLGESPADDALYSSVDRARKEYMAKANRRLVNDDATKINTKEEIATRTKEIGDLGAKIREAKRAGDKDAAASLTFRKEALEAERRELALQNTLRGTTDAKIKLQQRAALEKYQKEVMRDIRKTDPDAILNAPTGQVGVYAKIKAHAEKARRLSSAEGAGDSVARQIDEFADKLLEDSAGAMTIKSLRAARIRADGIAKFNKGVGADKTYLQKQFARIRDMMEEEVEASQARVATNLHPEDVGKYAAAKRDYKASMFVLNTTEGAAERLAVQKANAGVDAAITTLGAGVGAAVTGGPIGLLGAGLGLARPALQYALRDRAKFLTGNAMGAVGRALRPREEAVRAITSADADVERRVAKAVNAFMTRGTGSPTRVAVAASGRAYMAYDRQTAQKKTDEIIKVARAVANDPKAAAEVVQQVAGPLATYTPKVYARAAVNYSNAFQVMVKNLPPPRHEIGTLTVPVSESYDNETVAKVLRMADAMENPVGVIERLPTGDVTLEELEVVEAVAPTVFQDVRARMLEGLASGELNPGHREKVTLSLVFKTPADSSMTPESIRLSQLIYAQATDDDVGGPDGRAAPTQPRNAPSRPIEYASGMRTRSEVIESGGRVQ